MTKAPSKVDIIERQFQEWWSEDGRYIDPDTDDVPWFDKRGGLAQFAFIAGFNAALPAIVEQCAEVLLSLVGKYLDEEQQALDKEDSDAGDKAEIKQAVIVEALDAIRALIEEGK